MNIRKKLRKIALVRRVFRLALKCVGKDPWFRLDTSIASTFIGSDYGGWYVVTSLLPTRPRVLSVGVGTDVTFDQTMISTFDATIVACDPTPIAKQTVANCKLGPPSYSFHPVAVSDFDGNGEFQPVVVAGRPSGCYRLSKSTSAGEGKLSVPVKSIVTVLHDHCHGQLDVFKLDIEGAEYEVLPALVASGARPGQILVEFHHRFPDRGLSDTRAMVELLRGAGYRLVKVSDQGPESSFVHERTLANA